MATAPLPKRAQFLNVIESVFSGMARAVIQNSDYASVDEAPKRPLIDTLKSGMHISKRTPEEQGTRSGPLSGLQQSFPHQTTAKILDSGNPKRTTILLRG